MTVRGVIVLALVIVAALTVGAPSLVRGETYIVDDDDGTWANYTTIQDAVDVAVDGDTILVYNGTYLEAVVIDVSISLIGNGSVDTTVNASNVDDVIEVQAHNTNISHLEITGGRSGTYGAGIYLNGVRDCRINDTVIMDCSNAVYALDSWLIDVSDNILNDNINTGITLDNSTNSRIINNNCSDDAYGIVLLSGSDGNYLQDNIMYGSGHGIYLFRSEDAELNSNLMAGCGIMMIGNSEADFTHTIPTNNTVNDDPIYYLNGQIGGSVPVNAGEVILVGCDNVTVNAQTLLNGDVGVLVAYSDSTTIQNSFIQDNNWYNIRAVNSNWTTIDTVVATWGASGIYIGDSIGTSMVDINVSNNVAKGIWLHGADRTSLSTADIWSNGDEGLYLLDSDRCMIDNVTAGRNHEGIFLSNSINNSIVDSLVTKGIEGGMKLVADSGSNVIMNLTATENRDGFYGSSGANVNVSDSEFSNNSRADIWLSSFSLALLNSSFETVSNSGSTMPVLNYLSIRVVEDNSSVENVEVEVLDNNSTIYASPGYGGNDTTTGADGYVHDILVTDRVYDGSSTPIENITTVRVHFRSWSDSRDVNMSTTHTETFNYTENGTILYVDDDNAGDPSMDGSEEHPYDTVQRGIDNSTDNGTLRVWEGLYAENVIVNVTGLMLIGNGSANTTIDAANTGNTVTIVNSSVVIENFHITDSGTGTEDSGIHLDNVVNVVIRAVLVDQSQRGLFIDATDSVSVIGGSYENNAFGIYSDSAQYLNVTGSSIASNTNTGVYLDTATDVYFSGCTIHSNPTYGVYGTGSNNVILYHSNFTSNGQGVYVTSSLDTSVIDCDIISSTNNGIAFRANSNSFHVELCDLRSNNNGISIQQSIGEIGNTSINDSTSNDIELGTNAEATTYNVSFIEDQVACDPTSSLIVRNYLIVRVVNQYHEGIKDADVMIEDNNDTKYASAGYGGDDPETNGKGYIPEMLITDRIYDGSNTPTQNLTNATAKYEGEEVMVEINMSTSHTEILEINISLLNIVFVDDDNTGDPAMNGSLEHPYDTIQRGIDNATEGDTVRVFAGLYGEQVVIEKEIELKGNATDTQIKAPKNEDGIIVNAANVTIELVFVNRSTGSEVGVNGTDAAWNLTIRSVEIKGFDYGFFIDRAENIQLVNLTINNPEYGIYLLNVSNFTVMDSWMRHLNLNNSAAGIMIENGGNGTVLNNTIYSYYYSIRPEGTMNVTIDDNELDDAYALVYSSSTVRDITVLNNTISNATVGIGFVDTSLNSADITVDGNTIINIDNQAIYVFGTSGIEIMNNEITDALTGVHSVTTGDIHVHNNTISEIEIGVNSQFDSGVFFNDNVITNASERGISVFSTGDGIHPDPSVSSNTIFNATIGLYLKDVDSIMVHGNRIENSTDRGFVINTSMYLNVQSNELFNNTINIDIHGEDIEEYYHTITKSNKVNGNAVYYRVNNSDLDISGGMGYAGFINCDGEINDADVEPNAQGMLFISTDSFLIVNTSIETSNVQFILQGSNITILNTGMDENEVEMDENSTMTVSNYLQVHVNNSIGEDLENADVKVMDNNDTVYASSGYGGSDERTDSDGYVLWIRVTDRVYHGSGETVENGTVVYVKNNTWEETRNVSMDSTHTEWFEEGGSAGNERPLVNIIDPVEDDTIGGEYDINGNATDLDGVVIRVEVRIDNGTWRTCTGTEHWSYRWNTSEVDDGEHTIYARSYDGDLYSAEDMVNITVDNTNFAPNVSIVEPIEGETVEDTVAIKGNATDQDGDGDIDVVQVAITWNGSAPESGDWNDATDTSDNDTWESWEYLWNTSSEDDGEYTIWARAYDGTAYSERATANVTVYNPDPPVVAIVDPFEGEEVNATYFINGTASDPDPDDEVVAVYVAITVVGEDPGGPDWDLANDTSENGTWETWDYEWDTTEVEDGNYTIHARSYDGDETSETENVNVSVENVNFLPRLVTNDPEEAEDVSGTINVTGFVRDIDDEIDKIEVSIDDDEFENDLLTVEFKKVAWDRWEWWAEWDTSTFNQGDHTIFANATDERGGYREKLWVVNVTVIANVPPTLNFTNPAEDDDVDVYKGETDFFYIQWEDEDPDDDANIDLYHDDDDDGENGIEIVTGLSEDEEDGSGHEKDDYEWDISSMNAGTYYIYAILSDGGNNADVTVVSVGTVTIHEGLPNEAPTIDITQPDGEGDVIPEDGSFTIFFNATDGDGDDLTIRLYYDNDTDPSSYKGMITDSALDQNDHEYNWTPSSISGRFYIHAKVNDGTDEIWGTSPGMLTIGDIVAPAGVGNLSVEDTGFGETLGLTFTTPGDDRWKGNTEGYEIRYSTSSIGDENDWDAADNFTAFLTPNIPKVVVTIKVSGLEDDTEYHVAIRAYDDAGNMGPIESGSATPTFKENSAKTIRSLPSGYSATYSWVGTGTIDANANIGDYSVSGTGFVTLDDIFVSLEAVGFVTTIKLNFVYPSDMSSVDVSDAKVYRRSSGGGWVAVDRTGIHESNRTIWAVMDELSIFAPLGYPIGDPEVDISWSPEKPKEGQKVTFEVIYTDIAGRAPNNIYLYADNQRISLTEVNGTPEDGITYTAKEELDPGSYSIFVKYYYGDPEVEKTTTAMSLIVKEKEEDDELPMSLILAAVGGIVLLLIILMVVRGRKKAKGAEKEAAKPDIVEAAVVTDAFEDVGEPVTAEQPTEVVATAVAELAAEVPPHIAKAAAKAEEVTPMAVPPVIQQPTVPGAPPPMLKLPDVPGAPVVEVEPEVIEADLTDTGKLIFAPCPSCGNRLIIPKERPVDIACEKCGEEFTVN